MIHDHYSHIFQLTSNNIVTVATMPKSKSYSRMQQPNSTLVGFGILGFLAWDSSHHQLCFWLAVKQINNWSQCSKRHYFFPTIGYNSNITSIPKGFPRERLHEPDTNTPKCVSDLFIMFFWVEMLGTYWGHIRDTLRGQNSIFLKGGPKS